MVGKRGVKWDEQKTYQKFMLVSVYPRTSMTKCGISSAPADAAAKQMTELEVLRVWDGEVVQSSGEILLFRGRGCEKGHRVTHA